MRKFGPVRLITYYPKTDQGKDELERRVAEAHADAVTQIIRRQDCSDPQKLELLNAVIENARSLTKQQEENRSAKVAERNDRSR